MELFTFLKLVTLIRTLSSQSCDAAWTGSEEQGMMLARPHATLGALQSCFGFQGMKRQGILVKLQLLMDVLALA